MTLSYEQACATLKRLLEEEAEIVMDVGFREFPTTLHIVPVEEGYWVWFDTPDHAVEQVYPHDVRIELTEVKHETWNGVRYTDWRLNIGTPSDDNGHRQSLAISIDEGQEIFGPGVHE